MNQSDENAICKKLERIIHDQEMLIKQLEKLSKEEKMKSIEEAVDKTLERVNNSQMNIIEKVNNLQTKLDKIVNNHKRINFEQKELKVEITTRQFLQNELVKDLEELRTFIKTGRSPAKVITEKLKDCSKELFMIGVHQNEFSNSLEKYKVRLLSEIQKMAIDLKTVVEMKDDLSLEQKSSIGSKIKQVNSNL